MWFEEQGGLIVLMPYKSYLLTLDDKKYSTQLLLGQEMTKQTHPTLSNVDRCHFFLLFSMATGVPAVFFRLAYHTGL
jgi:hypothetical protein